MKYDIVNLNNKSRRGTYLYIKEKGHPSRYYKYSGQTGELEALINYYKDRTINKKAKGTSQQYKDSYHDRISKKKIPISKQSLIHKQAQRYLSKIKKQGNLNKIIGKGITETTTKNFLKAGQKSLKKTKKELLNDLVLNKALLNNLISEENMKKMKFRFEHRITIQNETGQTILTAKKFNITLDKLQKELKETIKEGETIQSSEKYGGAIQKLKNKGFIVSEDAQDGRISNIHVKTIFRKAR